MPSKTLSLIQASTEFVNGSGFLCRAIRLTFGSLMRETAPSTQFIGRISYSAFRSKFHAPGLLS